MDDQGVVYCTKCGAKLDGRARYCAACGNRIEPQAGAARIDAHEQVPAETFRPLAEGSRPVAASAPPVSVKQGATRRIHPAVKRGGVALAVVVLGMLVLNWASLAIAWAGMPARAQGELPNLAVMVGQDISVARRALGEHQRAESSSPEDFVLSDLGGARVYVSTTPKWFGIRNEVDGLEFILDTSPQELGMTPEQVLRAVGFVNPTRTGTEMPITLLANKYSAVGTASSSTGAKRTFALRSFGGTPNESNPQADSSSLDIVVRKSGFGAFGVIATPPSLTSWTPHSSLEMGDWRADITPDPSAAKQYGESMAAVLQRVSDSGVLAANPSPSFDWVKFEDIISEFAEITPPRGLEAVHLGARDLLDAIGARTWVGQRIWTYQLAQAAGDTSQAGDFEDLWRLWQETSREVDVMTELLAGTAKRGQGSFGESDVSGATSDETQNSTSADEYATSLGGTSHKGETLYFVIGRSLQTEGDAQKALEEAIPLFGDMQTYFVVKKTDDFDGLKAGLWVVAEAYYEQPSVENIDLGKRAFPDAYVKKATVKTATPIPVYEDSLN